jgi:hypothetical protein
MGSDISTAFSTSADNYFDITERGTARKSPLKNVYNAPQPYEEDGKTVYYYGFIYKIQQARGPDTLKLAWFSSLNAVRLVFSSIRMLTSGQAQFSDLTVPVGITATMSSVAKQDMSSFCI